jgi:hypothetical protein
VSNKRRLRSRRTALVMGFAASYSCGHCTASTRSKVARGAALIDVFHDPDCPVLRGLVDDVPATMRAFAAAVTAFSQHRLG